MKKRDRQGKLIADSQAFTAELIERLEAMLESQLSTVAHELELQKLISHDRSILISLPGATAQAPHADLEPTLVREILNAGGPYAASVILALEDRTSLIVWEGSHIRLQPSKCKGQRHEMLIEQYKMYAAYCKHCKLQ